MLSIRRGAVALAIGMLAAALPLEAQGWKQLRFSIGGGAGVPILDFDETYSIGWHGLAAVSYTLPNAPLAFQVDGVFSRFESDFGGGNETIIYGTGDLLYQIRVSQRFVPYLIGGGGVYNIDPSGQYGFSKTHLGLNGGIGMTVGAGRVDLFVESRFHRVAPSDAADRMFVNFTAGLRFGPQ